MSDGYGLTDIVQSIERMTHAIVCAIEKLGGVTGGNDNNREVLRRIAELERTIMASQAEVAKQLAGAIERITKIGNETRKLLTLIEELKAGGGINTEASPEMKAKADELDVQLGVVDELVPDESAPTA